MTRYRFQVHDGHHVVEPETVNLPDASAAWREGIRRAGATLVLDAHRLKPDSDWRLDVTDERDTLLYRFDFSTTVAPAARG